MNHDMVCIVYATRDKYIIFNMLDTFYMVHSRCALEMSLYF